MKTPVAIGLNGLADWSAAMPFIDVLKCGRAWQARSATNWNHTSETRMKADGHLDANGYPIRIPSGANRVGTIILTEIDRADTSLNGRYRLTFTGEGTLQINGGQNVTQGPGWREFDYTAAGSNMVTIDITAINASNPLKLTACVRTDHIARHAAGEIFRPAWLDVVKPFGLFRLMDWQATNNSTLSRWADRPTAAAATYTQGAPVEIMVALCNLTGADPWFCIPHLANDDYITRFAAYVRQNLRADLVARFEFSNEVWNFLFEQAHWADREGKALWPGQGDAWMQFYGGRSSQMAQLIDAAYSGTTGRHSKVITTHTAWEGLEDGILNAPRWVAMQAGRKAPKTYFDEYAVTGYFGHGLSAQDVQGWRSLGEGPAFDRMAAVLDREITGLEAKWRYHKRITDAAGLDLVMYEGGSHVTPDHGVLDRNAGLLDFITRFHYSQQMGTLYTRALRAFPACGGEGFNVFVGDPVRPGPHGFWGAMRYVGDQNPRRAAIAAYNAAGGATEPAPVIPPAPVTPTPEVPAMPNKVAAFNYQNSLLDHRHGPGADKDTNAPNWVHRMAAAAGLTYQATGKFGFAVEWPIPPRADVVYEDAKSPPGIPNWTTTWDGYRAIDLVTFTPDNFDSFDRAPDVNSNNAAGPLGRGQNYKDRILQVIDAWEKNAPNANRRYAVYAGWADFKPRSGGAEWNRYTPAQLQRYLDWSYGGYHKWYVDLVAMLKKARPNLKIELFDVQRVMMRTWQGTALKSLSGSRLWEDNSPHGTETWYLLAGIVYYMEAFGSKPPANFSPQSGVDAVMRNNWSAIVDYAWKELGNTAVPVTPPPVVTPDPVEPEPVDPKPVDPKPVDPKPTGGKPTIKPEGSDFWTVSNVGDGVNLSVSIKAVPAADPAVTGIRIRQDAGKGRKWDFPAQIATHEIDPDPAFAMTFQRMDVNSEGGSAWASHPDEVKPTKDVPVEPEPVNGIEAVKGLLRDALARLEAIK